MREALFVSAIVLVAALAFAGPAPGAGAAAGEAGPEDLLALALARAGEPGWRATVREFENGALVERELTPAEYAERASQALRVFASAAGAPLSQAPGPVHVGAGSDDLDLPYPGCAPVALMLFALVPEDAGTNTIHMDGSTLPRELRLFEEHCGLEPQLQFTALADAATARATCSQCAVAWAQAWADEAGPAMHTNDFRYVHVSGIGQYYQTDACFTGFCIRGAYFSGNHATIQLVDDAISPR